MQPFVSIVVPCRNERAFIARCLESVTLGDYPQDRREVLVVDGMSEDGTREIVREYEMSHPSVRLVDNPARTTPAALNVGIRAAAGNLVVRMDAHCVYPRTYISQLVDALQKTDADNVGGVCRTLPADSSATARAIALGMSHPFGVGNAYFRIGTNEPRWVDTVPFGCYHRTVFDRIGMFDEELVRNQDDEFNGRLVRRGGRILLIPHVVVDYFARDALGKVWTMYWQYGLFKPLVALKLGRPATLRQLVPALFVLYLLAVPAGILLWPAAAAWLLLPLLVYTIAAVAFACRAGWDAGARVMAMLPIVFATLHIAYGLGYLLGVMRITLRRPTGGGVTDVAVSR